MSVLDECAEQNVRVLVGARPITSPILNPRGEEVLPKSRVGEIFKHGSVKKIT